MKKEIKKTDCDKKHCAGKLPPKMQIGILDGYCNLKCPMCFVHSSEKENAMDGLKGEMPFDRFVQILDEVKDNHCVISPYRWSEPLIFKQFAKYAKAVKERGMPLVINTNGMLLTKELAQILVDIQFDSVSFSIDAVTENVFKKMRGVSGLEKIKQNLFMMLDVRGDRSYPRIGASLALGPENHHEKEEFVSYWIQYVDVVRINKLLDSNFTAKDVVMPQERVPCSLLYDSMVVDFKGDVVMCCLDALGKTNMGNVFKDGVKKVWNGEPFKEARHLHETGQYEKLELCKKCSNWANINFTEEKKGDVLIRESPIMTFFNRLDRLKSWKH